LDAKILIYIESRASIWYFARNSSKFHLKLLFKGSITERITTNARHAIGDGDGGKARATLERRTSNARHTVGDGDGGKAGAITKRIISNAHYAVGDGDGGEARAITVFATCCVSKIFGYNGRKVMA